MSTNYSPTIVTDGAVFVGDALMPSTATSATKLYDRVGGNNGTMYNGACLDFDGTDDYVEIATTYEPGNGNWALSMWINADAWSSYTLMGNTSGGPSASRYYISTAGKISFSNYDGAWQHANGNTVLSLSTWYFCTWVNYAGSSSTNGTMKMFVNGVADSSAVNSYTTNGGRLNAIGQNTASYFDGKIADVRFYNVALSDANVKELYNDSKVIIPSNVSQTNLTRWWTFAEGAGTICYDALGYTKYATMTNMTSADWLTGQTGAPQLVEGYNRPMLFDGNNDYLKCGDVGNFTGSLSISLWFYANSNASASRLIAKDMASGGNPRWLIYKSTGTSLILYFDDNVNTATSLAAAFSTYGTWHHVAATITSGSAKIYIDGALVTSSTETTSSFTTDNDLWIGRYASSSYFDGIINEVVLYDSVLTLAQVQALAATGPNGGPLPPDPMSLSNSSDVTGYWRNDGIGEPTEADTNVRTWADRSGNGNDGTVYGSPDAVLFKQGINGSKNVNTGRDNQGFPLKYKDVGAIGFNGSDTKVTFSDVDLNLLTGATISFWCNHSDNVAGVAVGSDDNGYHSYVQPHGNGNFYLETSSNEGGRYGTMNYKTGFHHYVVVVLNYIPYFYEDGVDITVANAAFTAGNVSFNYIGTSGAKWFQGSVAALQFYNRALSYAEIQQNYKAQRSRFT